MSDTLINKIDINFLELMELEIDDIVDMAKMFSHIVDFRSSFTARHSAGVASVAHELSKMMCFSPIESKMILVAGYLHDLGKLTISDSILEKPGKLSDDEYHIIRSHTYFTYQLLDSIPKLREINKWASFHHERMDGCGYPFHIKGEDLPLGSRIMAVADVFTAIKEDRPYRAEVSDEKAMSILTSMAKSGGLDIKVVDILIENFNEINKIRNDAQKNATLKYNNFFSSPSSI